jgi:tetratricopeptide (TPR) repeat protein
LSRLVLRGDPAVGPEARVARVMAAFAEYERASAAAVARWPGDARFAYYRAGYFLAVGRPAEAAALLAPFTADIEASVRRDREWGPWAADRAAYALMLAGREEEAIALIGRLMRLSHWRTPHLLGPGINFAWVLWQAKRPAEALAHIETMMRPAQRRASGGGWMVIAAYQVCALESLARRGESAGLVEAMLKVRRDNGAAMMRALLCAGDLDAAEALLIERLKAKRPVLALVALQNYRPGGADLGFEGVLVKRLRLLRGRPAVRAAIARAGVILDLPLVWVGDL